MKYMITWKVLPGCYKDVAEAFLSTGGPVPDGVKTVGRWHAPGTGYGWHLVESENGAALSQAIAEWAHVVDYQISPVVEDADAASGISKVYGQ